MGSRDDQAEYTTLGLGRMEQREMDKSREDGAEKTRIHAEEEEKTTHTLRVQATSSYIKTFVHQEPEADECA